MRILVFLCFLNIYACKENPKNPRSVNLALETVLEFNNNEHAADLQIIDKVKGFLDKIKFVIAKNKRMRRGNRRNFDGKPMAFSDFVKNAIVTITALSDEDMDEVLSAIDAELRKYHYKGCKFYELIENYNVRRYMAEELETFRTAPTNVVRRKLNKIHKALDEEKEKSLVDYIDSLYASGSDSMFRRFLNALSMYKGNSKRTKMNINNIVRDGIRSVIFDYYSGLDFKTRRDIKVRLETFWKDLANPKKDSHHVWKYQNANPMRKLKDNAFVVRGKNKKIERNGEEIDDIKEDNGEKDHDKVKKSGRTDEVKEEKSMTSFEERDENNKKNDEEKDERNVEKQGEKNEKEETSERYSKEKEATTERNMDEKEEKNERYNEEKEAKSERNIDEKAEKTERYSKEKERKSDKNVEEKDEKSESSETTTTTTTEKVTKRHKKSHKKEKLRTSTITSFEEIPKENYLHDSNIAIHVGRNKDDDDANTKTSTKREKLTFITLYPEKITYSEAKTTKARKTHKKKESKKKQTTKDTEEKKKKDRLTEKTVKKFMAKQAEMEKMMAEHEEIKKKLAKQADVDKMMYEIEMMKKVMAEQTKQRKTMMSQEDSDVEHLRSARKRDMRAKLKALSKKRHASRMRHAHQRYRKPVKHYKRTRRTDSEENLDKDSQIERPRKGEKSRKNLESKENSDSGEGLPIEASEFQKNKKQKNFKNFRKSIVNDTLLNDTILMATKTPENVVKKIKDLEEELKSFKKIAPKIEVEEVPTYDTLNFWEGTTKTTEMTTVETTTTTTATKTAKTKVKATTKTKPTLPQFTTKNSTYEPVFRTQNFSIDFHKQSERKSTTHPEVDKNILKVTPFSLGKRSHEDVEEKVDNSTKLVHSEGNEVPHSDMHDITTHNDSVLSPGPFDEMNDIAFGLDALGNAGTNVTAHIENLEKYLNSTKDNPNDKRRIVRKKMMEDLKGILAAPSEEIGNHTQDVFLGKELAHLAKTNDTTIDPLYMLDDTGLV